MLTGAAMFCEYDNKAPWRSSTTILPRVVKRPRPSHPPRTGRGRARPRLYACDVASSVSNGEQHFEVGGETRF